MSKTLTVIQITLGFALGLLVYSLYHYNAPVLMFMEAKNWNIEGDQISAEIEGYKVRNCAAVRNSTIGYVNRSGILYEVPIEATIKYPASIVYKIDFGEWNWTYDPKKPQVTSVMAIVKYECDGTMIYQPTGPFEIPQEILSQNMSSVENLVYR